MIGGRQWAIKKFLRGYAVTIVTSALLILVLALLIWARLGDLYSVRDISKINPLITSGQNELVAQKDGNGLTRLVREDRDSAQSDGATSKDIQKGDTTQPTDNSSNQTPTGTGSTGGGSSTGTGSGGSGGSGGGGTTAGGGSGGGETQPPRAFVITASEISHTTSSPLVNISSKCDVTHTFTATITAQYAPGDVRYKWVKVANGATTQYGEQTLSFGANETVKTTPLVSWVTSGTTNTGSYSMSLVITSPAAGSKMVSFKHICLVLGL